MKFQPGMPKPPNSGRKKGGTNKHVGDLRAIFKQFVERNLPRMQMLFDELAEKDQKAAANIVLEMADFCIPRLQRTEWADVTEKPTEDTDALSDAQLEALARSGSPGAAQPPEGPPLGGAVRRDN